MSGNKQLWVLAGGNGAGKSTFYNLLLSPKGIKFVNADLIARHINIEKPEAAAYAAADLASKVRDDLLTQSVSFCFESVFSHVSKIDFIAKAKSLGYFIVLVYIHLESVQLNEARVKQRVSEGGHTVPADKIRNRIPKTIQNVTSVLPLVDEARLLDNSSRSNPFRQIAVIRKGHCVYAEETVPEWAESILEGLDSH